MKEHPIATGTIGADGKVPHPVTAGGRTREEQALVELGHTTFSRGVAWTLTAVFICTIVVVPIVQGWSMLLERTSRPTARMPRGEAAVLQAGWPDPAAVVARVRRVMSLVPSEQQLRHVETLMEQRSVVGRFVRSRVQNLLARWLSIGNDNVYIGRDRWLFYRPGVEYVTGPGFLSPSVLARRRANPDVVEPDPRPSILRFNEQLARRGITLVLLPTPDKIMMHPDRFYGRKEWASMPQNPSFDRLLLDLEQHGVRVLDPAPALYARRAAQQLFLRTDTHWMPGTAEAVARDLATQIKVAVRMTPMRSPYRTRRTDVFWGVGDLPIIMQLPADHPFVDPVTVNVRQVLDPTGGLWTPAPDAPVVMLGDSFCMIYETDQGGRLLAAGLPQQLSYELGQPVDRICAAGAGSSLTRLLLVTELATGKRTLDHVRVVVWQFTIRDLVVGDWRVIDLP